MASSMRAPSATVRVIGPIASCVKETGTIPARLINPDVGRMPTRLLAEEGERIEFPGAPELLVYRIRLLQSHGIDENHRVELGALLVVHLNPLEISLNQGVTRQRSRTHRRMNATDGSFLQLK